MSEQIGLPLIPVKADEVNGLEMGVLPDGTAYLTGRGLATACGVSAGTILTLDGEWTPDSLAPRHQKIGTLLESHNFSGEQLFVKVRQNGIEVNAHPEQVCMALLEYYAFETTSKGAPTAQRTFRNLARVGLKKFVYSSLGFDPQEQISKSWRNFQDRLLLNQIPTGFFSVFSESAVLVVPAINGGLVVDESVVPDISVGSAWARHWKQGALEAEFGARKKHPHTYPEGYAQSTAQTAIEAWVYPLASIGRFRVWLQDEYLPDKFPAYLKRKERDGKLLPEQRAKIFAALNPKNEDKS